MQKDDFCKADLFLGEVHPFGCKGSIVLEGPVKKKFNESMVSSEQLVRLTKQACIQKDILFSPSRFHGRTLLLNFAGTNVLFAAVPINHRQYNIQSINKRLEAANIPASTIVLDTGTQYYLIWIIDEALRQDEFYKGYLFQSKVFHVLEKNDFSPDPVNLELVSKIPVPGSINSRTNQHVSLVPTFSGSIITKEVVDSVIFGGVDIAEKGRITSHARILQELLALFDSRVLMISSRPDLFKDWIFFIGCSLRLFCSDKQLEKELSSVVRALEGFSWEKGKEKYGGLIKEIAFGADGLNIRYVNRCFNLSTWANCISGRLDVTREEIDLLGLQFIAGEDNIPTIDMKQVVTHQFSFTTDDEEFIPVGELFMRNAS